MDDCINRQRLLKGFCAHCTDYESCKGRDKDCFDRKYIENQPTVFKTSPWISVYERLPEKREKVCVTDGKHTWDCGEFQGVVLLDGYQEQTRWYWKHNTVRRVRFWMPKKTALPPVPEKEW